MTVLLRRCFGVARRTGRVIPGHVRAALLVGFVTLGAAAPSARVAPATVVLLVRHAEKAPGAGDVPLSDVGRVRAQVLAQVGQRAGAGAIITTQFARTRETASTLASEAGIVPDVVAAQSDVARHAADVATAVRRHTGKVVLVVGHSNTIPSIVSALGGTKYPDLCDAEYDALFTVVLDDEGAARTIRSRYGAATPVGSDCRAMR
ncbi:MAG TPA: histidine phosphatase family protein [Gemmatimonadaceae bacterium]